MCTRKNSTKIFKEKVDVQKRVYSLEKELTINVPDSSNLCFYLLL